MLIGVFTIAVDVAQQSILIKNLLEDCEEFDQAVPIPNVSFPEVST